MSPEQLTKYVLYCEWLIYATWRVTDNLSSLLQSIGASEKVFQLIDLLPSDQFLSKGKHPVYCGILIFKCVSLNHGLCCLGSLDDMLQKFIIQYLSYDLSLWYS